MWVLNKYTRYNHVQGSRGFKYSLISESECFFPSPEILLFSLQQVIRCVLGEQALAQMCSAVLIKRILTQLFKFYPLPENIK